jgi:hypothetical protein
MDDPNLPHRETPQEVADHVAQKYFGVTDEASRARVIRKGLSSVIWFTILIPTAFYLRFRHIVCLGSLAFVGRRHAAAGLERDECQPRSMGRAHRATSSRKRTPGIVSATHSAES